MYPGLLRHLLYVRRRARSKYVAFVVGRECLGKQVKMWSKKKKN